MNALFRWRWLLAGLLWLSLQPAAHASHVIGGDIAYASVASTTAGVPRYRVTMRLFRDIIGVDQPTVQLTGTQGSCNSVDPQNFTIQVRKSQSTRLAQVGCPTGPYGGISYYDVFLYAADVDLPRGQWTLSFTADYRSDGIRNIPNSLTTTFLVSASLNTTLAAENTSPTFLSALLPTLQGNLAQAYSFSTYDRDRDSVAYSMVESQTALNPLVPCSTPIAGAISPHFQLNPATGALSAPAGAVQQGRYALAVRVSEYRQLAGAWQLIGTVTRDIVYLAQNIANQPPSFTSLAVSTGVTQLPNQTITVRPGQTVNLTLTATDPDTDQQLRFSSEATNIIPGLSLATLNATQARLTWQVPANLPVGFYTATIAAFDNGCPNSAVEQTLYFRVTNQVLATRLATDAETTAFPMPFRDQVQFQAASGNQLILIADALGRTVAQLRAGADGRVVWQPASTLPAGLYVARNADGKLLARLLRAAE